MAYLRSGGDEAGDAKAACNWVTNEVLASLKERGEEIDRFPLAADRLGTLVAEVKGSGLKRQKARDVYAEMLASGGTAAEAMAKLGYVVENNEAKLRAMIRTAIDANPQAAADFKAGKVKAADRIKGAVMKETKGMANAETVNRLLLEELAK